VTVESRRASVEFAAELTSGIRPDTLFAPFHWGGRQAANLLTSPALDPISRMPEFKLAAVRIAGVRQSAGPSMEARA
jgi:assimilatory nitrate reductase catalytic subunit